MGTGLTVTVILAMIALGVFVIHLLNAQHNDRIALHRYSRRIPDRRGSRNPARPQQVTAASPRSHAPGPQGRRPRTPAPAAQDHRILQGPEVLTGRTARRGGPVTGPAVRFSRKQPRACHGR